MPILDDSVRVFANAAARDSFLTSPKSGQVAVLLDTGAMVIYQGPTLGWRPPWNSQWGEVARIELTSFHQFVNVNDVEPALGAVTFTPVAGRHYEARWRLTVETKDKGQGGDVGMALVVSFGSTSASLASLSNRDMLDGVVLPVSTIQTFYPLQWRRQILHNRDITNWVTPNAPATMVAQYAYGSANPGTYAFTTTTDGLYGNNDFGSESSFSIHDIGPTA